MTVTRTRKVAKTIAIKILVVNVSPLYGSEMVGSSQLKWPGAGGITFL